MAPDVKEIMEDIDVETIALQELSKFIVRRYCWRCGRDTLWIRVEPGDMALFRCLRCLCLDY